MKRMQLKTYLESNRKAVDKALDKVLTVKDEVPKVLLDSIRYSVFAGGKRIRPILCLCAGEVVGAQRQAVMPVACAIELIHTYSLIHDDLPALDNDDFRRGKPSNHKVFGEDIAIGAGDALLTYAFEVISRECWNKKTDPRITLKVIWEISKAAGLCGMVAGQIADLKSTGKKVNKKALEYIHTHKTAALITASVLSGAIIAKATEKELSALTEYAKNIGLAFQIADDLLDALGTKEKLGKSIGKDAAQKKITYVSVFGLKKSQQMAVQTVEQAKKALSIFKNRALILEELADFIIKRTV